MVDENLQETWRQYRIWAGTSGELKRTYETARTQGIGLAITAAALATAASIEPGYAGLLGGLSGLLIAIAAWVGREFLTPDDESKWVRARLMAEAFKREFWRAT